MKKNSYTSYIARFATPILVVGFLLTLVGGYFSVKLYQNLRTDIEELLPTEARSGKDLKALTERMESFDYIGILVFSKDAKGSRRYVDELAKRLQAIPKDLATRIEYKIGDEMAFFRRRAGLFLDVPDLYRVRDYVKQRIKWEKEMYNPLNIFPVSDRVKKPELDFDELTAKYQGGGSYDTYPDGYYATADGGVHAILAFMTGKHSDIHRAHALKAEIDKAIAGLDSKQYASDIEIHFTGGIQSFIEEHAALIADLELSTVVVVLLVTLSMLFYYKDWVSTLALMISLGAGCMITFGISYFVVGYLNANSAFLGSIVIGNGINYGIMLVARYVEERTRKVKGLEATDAAIRNTVTATMAASFAAGLAYGSLMLTRFRGFQQFGVIGLIGMVICWGCSFTILPALLILIERRWPKREPPNNEGNYLDRLCYAIAKFVKKYAKPVAYGSIALSLISVAMLPRIDKSLIETNLNKLRNKETIERGAGFYDRYLIDIFKAYLTHTVVLTETREQAVEVARKLREVKKAEGAESLISNVQTLSDFVPADQEKKIPILRQIKRELTPKIIQNLEPKEQQWIRDFLSPEAFHTFGENDLPQLVLTKFKEKSGELGKLVVVDPPLRNGGDVAWKGETLLKFVGQVRATADEVKAGLPVAGQLPISADMVESILNDGPQATVFALLAVIILVVVIFRHLPTIGLALFALIQGVLWMAGIILLFRLKINFLNFIALPITFGIGVDYGVNVFQRYRLEKENGNPEGILQVVRQTGGAVMLACLTTLIGYSSLVIAGNQAFVSFGNLALLGEFTCVIAAVVSLPAFIYYREQTKAKRAKLGRLASASPVSDRNK